VTSGDLAAITGLHERWLREWLRGQAAAQLLASEDGETFLLRPEAAAVLARSGGPTFAPGYSGTCAIRRWPTASPRPSVQDSDLHYDDQGEGSEDARRGDAGADGPHAAGTRRRCPCWRGSSTAWAPERRSSMGVWRRAGPGTPRRRLPNSEFEGYDISERAIAVARKRFADRANVTVAPGRR
jgi:hypothetical protein